VEAQNVMVKRIWSNLKDAVNLKVCMSGARFRTRNLSQGCCASGKPGKTGKIREFDFDLENLEKSGNFTPLSGKTIFFFKN